jgi:short-subunit dehydrogenase involved in D-alanine esterification of teichoic acids
MTVPERRDQRIPKGKTGAAAARRFVKEEAYVFITGRRQAELDKVVH